MQATIKAPEVDRFIHRLSRVRYRELGNVYTYDNQSYRDIDEIFRLVSQIAPANEYGTRSLWIQAKRGSIEDFGDFEEYLEDEAVSSKAEFEVMWQSLYPDEVNWYAFTAFEDAAIDYRAISVGNKFVIEVDGRKTERGFEHNISQFTRWILAEIRRCISMLADGTYNQHVANNLPAWHRTGTICRKDFWDVFPEDRIAFFSSISQSDVDDFTGIMRRYENSDALSAPGLRSMTANDFYRFCSLGYIANGYSGIELPPKAQYYLHADGRDAGLAGIDLDNPDAFRNWLHHRESGCHPFEVCRGGNSTHIDLFVWEQDDGFHLEVAGSAWNRTIEAVKFFLALHRAGLPVEMRQGQLLGKRLSETEQIGIVPAGVFPAYCANYFPDRDIIDYINLPEEKQDKIIPLCTWYPIEEIALLEKQESAHDKSGKEEGKE